MEGGRGVLCFGPWKVLEPQTIILSHLAQGPQWQPSRPCSRESHKWSGHCWKGAPVLHSEWDTILGKGNGGSKGDPDRSNPRMDAGAGRGQRNTWAPIWASGNSGQHCYTSLLLAPFTPAPDRVSD